MWPLDLWWLNTTHLRLLSCQHSFCTFKQHGGGGGGVVSASHRPGRRGQLYPHEVPPDSASSEFTYLNVSLSNSRLRAEVAQQYVSRVWPCSRARKPLPAWGGTSPRLQPAHVTGPALLMWSLKHTGEVLGEVGLMPRAPKQPEPAGPTTWLVRSPIPVRRRSPPPGPCHPVQSPNRPHKKGN